MFYPAKVFLVVGHFIGVHGPVIVVAIAIHVKAVRESRSLYPLQPMSVLLPLFFEEQRMVIEYELTTRFTSSVIAVAIVVTILYVLQRLRIRWG